MNLSDVLMRSLVLGGSGLFGGVDWLTLLALLAVGVLYFLAPVLGYRARGRGLMVASMWVLIAKMSLSVLRVCIFALEVVDGGKMTGGGRPTSSEVFFVLLMMFENGLFVLSIVLFVIGLLSLRRDMDLPRELPRGFRDD